MATDQPLPDQGPGLGLLTPIYDLVLLALTAALALALGRLPGRYRRLAQHGANGWPDLLRRAGLIAGLHFVWPAVVLYLALAVPFWQVDVAMGQPDLTAWLEAVAIVVALKGALELVLTWRAFTSADQARIREVYPGATGQRLAEVKQRYDPTNLFRLNHNITPGLIPATVERRAGHALPFDDPEEHQAAAA